MPSEMSERICKRASGDRRSAVYLPHALQDGGIYEHREYMTEGFHLPSLIGKVALMSAAN